MVNSRTRGEEAASARQYAYAVAEFTSSPGAPGMRCKKARGETTLGGGRQVGHPGREVTRLGRGARDLLARTRLGRIRVGRLRARKVRQQREHGQ